MRGVYYSRFCKQEDCLRARLGSGRGSGGLGLLWGGRGCFYFVWVGWNGGRGRCCSGGCFCFVPIRKFLVKDPVFIFLVEPTIVINSMLLSLPIYIMGQKWTWPKNGVFQWNFLKFFAIEYIYITYKLSNLDNNLDHTHDCYTPYF